LGEKGETITLKLGITIHQGMKAILFDLGHTLIDYHNEWVFPEKKAIGKAYQLACATFGRPPDESTFNLTLSQRLEEARERKVSEMVEVPLASLLEDFFAEMGLEADGRLVNGCMEAFYDTLVEHRRLVEGSREMLETVRQRGYRIGLISDVAWGLPSSFPLRDMRIFSIDPYFDSMIFSTDVGLRKPNPKIFEIALESLGVSAEESMYVGNSLQADIKGAKDSGLVAVLKRSSYYFHDDDIRPDAVVERWSEMVSLLDRL